MSEDSDFEFDDGELNRLFDEVERLLKLSDRADDIHRILRSVLNQTEILDDNIESLKRGFNPDAPDSDAGSFYNGVILGGLLSAYENFVRQIAVTLVDDPSFWEYIQEAGNAHTGKEIIPLTKLKNPEKLKHWFRYVAKLNNPEKVSLIFIKFYGLPVIKIDDVGQLVDTRNAFAHNGGTNEVGKRIEIKKDVVLRLFSQMTSLTDQLLEVLNARCAEDLSHIKEDRLPPRQRPSGM